MRQERSIRLRRRLKVALHGSPAFTIDISKGGFCLELLRVLPPGTPVSGSIALKDREVPFTGRVAWAKPGDVRMNLRGRMGITLITVPQEFTQFIESDPQTAARG